MTKNVTNVTFQASKKIAATVAAAATDRQRNSFITFKSQPIVEALEEKTTVLIREGVKKNPFFF